MSFTVTTDARAGGGMAVFATAIFLSASLLFFVQPMYAKMVLPHLGGAPSVWTTAMLFFQTALLLGYAYAHLISTRLGLRAQIAVHGAVWAAGLAFLPIAIPGDWTYDPDAHPAAQTLMLFAAGVGVPFVALAANAPLLQKWYARSGGPNAGDPYHLYAASNAGSLIALLGYPLLAEPLAGAGEISRAWAGLYVVLGLALSLCAAQAFRGGTATDPQSASATRYRPQNRELLLWCGLAFVPSSMMLGVTSTVSSDLGAFPLVWVIPLALYLLTFVLAFSSRLRPPRSVLVLLFLISVIAAVTLLAANSLSALRAGGFAILFLAFFCVALLFHIRLYEARPPEAGLTPFYFAMATGGALGGLFNSILAPLLFDRPIEVLAVFALAGLALEGPRRLFRDIGAGAVAAALGFALITAGMLAGMFETVSPRWAVICLVGLALLLSAGRPVRFAATAALSLALGHHFLSDAGVIHRERSFFGIYTIWDHPESGLRSLRHGTTNHGRQFVEDQGLRPRILSYYHPDAPLGQVFGSGEIGPEARVGVVGLGAGALACYARPGQAWRFYEIDPVVDRIARDPRLFSYMENCARDAPTILGDARVTLANEPAAAFDVLVIDAYSSDAIPIHLMTLEALELYLSRLTPGGVLALHISNRYYDLAPILASTAGRLGVPALLQFAQGPLAPGQDPSRVVLMAAEPQALEPFARDPRWLSLEPNGRRPWTDDHASVLDAL